MDAFPSRRSDPDLGAFAKRVLLVFLFGAIALALRQLAELAIVLFGAILLDSLLQSAGEDARDQHGDASGEVEYTECRPAKILRPGISHQAHEQALRERHV